MPPPDDPPTLRKSYEVVGWTLIVLLVIAACSPFIAAWFWHVSLLDFSDWKTVPALMVFAWIAFTSVSAYWYEPCEESIPPLPVVVIVTMRAGDDLSALAILLRSLSRQTIPPTAVYLVENGGPRSGTIEVHFDKWKWSKDSTRIALGEKQYLYYPEPSKRAAHALVFEKLDPNAIAMTVDSYTELSPDAIAAGLRCFSDANVIAVTGLLVGRGRGLLAYAADQLFAAGFLQERAAWSVYGACSTRGGLALYRVNELKTVCEAYVSKTIAGQSVEDGDDRALSNLAARGGGKIVFQATCTGYTCHPETLRPLIRRHVRWWRTLWRSNAELLRHLPVRRAAWRLNFLQCVMCILQGAAYPAALVIEPIIMRQIPWKAAAFLLAVSCVRTLPTLAVKRPGWSLARQIGSFVILLPVITLLDLWLSVVQMWRGLLTVHKTEWLPWHTKAREMSVK